MYLNTKRVSVRIGRNISQALKKSFLGVKVNTRWWKVELIDGDGSIKRVSEKQMSAPRIISGDIVILKRPVGPKKLEEFYIVDEPPNQVTTPQGPVMRMKAISLIDEKPFITSEYPRFPTPTEFLQAMTISKSQEDLERYIASWELDWVNGLIGLDPRIRRQKIHKREQLGIRNKSLV